MDKETVRRIVTAAYEAGWADACDDHNLQASDASHAIGTSRVRNVDDLLIELDPFDLLGVRVRP